MSSLLQTASPWTNDNSHILKKRISTMKNTLKKVQSAGGIGSQNENIMRNGSAAGSAAAVSSSSSSSIPIMNEYYYLQSQHNNNDDYGINDDTHASNHQENFENTNTMLPPTIEQTQQIMDSRTSTINNLLNTIGIATGDNAGSNLVNFKPPTTTQSLSSSSQHNPSYLSQNFNPPPVGVLTKTPPSAGQGQSFMTSIKPVDLFPKAPTQKDRENFQSIVGAGAGTSSRGGDYRDYTTETANTATNYNTVYSGQMTDLQNTPYYAKMGIGAGSNGGGSDEKLMERLNYMIHLLEQQQNEKTTNVMEEVILYAMLGVFVIFVVDSFRQSGKYIR